MGSIVRPLKYSSANTLKEMTDSELDLLSWCLRKYYADRLAESHDMPTSSSPYTTWQSGRCTTANVSGNPAVGSLFMISDLDGGHYTDNSSYWDLAGSAMFDKRKDFVRNTSLDDYGGAPDDDDATDPGEAAFDDTNAIRYRWWFQQRKVNESNTLPSLPSNSTYDSSGYFVWNGSNSIQIDNTVADIAHTIIKDANYQMLHGDELGTYRLSSSAMTSGNDIWMPNSDIVFWDSLSNYTWLGSLIPVGWESYLYAVSVYYLYLKVYSDPPSSGGDTLRWMGSPYNGLVAQHTWVEMDLIKNILYPLWIQSSFADLGGYGYPRYSVAWDDSSITSSHEELRGTLVDTSYTNSTARQYGPHGSPSTYYYDRYGSGATSTNATFYFKIHWPSASYLRG